MNKADIVIMSPKIFQQTIENFREVSPYPFYKLQNAVISKENKVTKFSNTCTLLAMDNGNSTYLGHFAPEYKTSDFKQKLDYIVKKFKDETGKLFAVIAGGYDYKIPSKFILFKNMGLESYAQLAEAGEILDRNGASLTMICGKKTPVFTDNLAVTKDRFILSHNPKTHGSVPTQHLKPNITANELEDFLCDEYRIVEINPDHSISFLG